MSEELKAAKAQVDRLKDAIRDVFANYDYGTNYIAERLREALEGGE